MPPYKHKPNTPRMDLYSQIIMFIPDMSDKHIIVFCNTFTFYKRHCCLILYQKDKINFFIRQLLQR